MTLEQFVGGIKNMADNFEADLKNLKSSVRPEYEAQWMALFLKWAEWGTEMQDTYWYDGSE